MSVDFEVKRLEAPNSKAPPSILTGDTCKGSGRIKVGSDGNSYNLALQPDGKVFLHFTAHDMEVDTSGEMVIVGNEQAIRSTHRNTAEVNLIIHDIPLPSGDNLRLQGTKQMSIGGGPESREDVTRADVTWIHTPASYGGIYGIWDLNNPPKAATVKYDLVPVVEDLKLNVFIDDYDTWIPEGNKGAAEAGNELKIRAELKTVADAWKQQEGASGLADESDDDAEPQGDPTVRGDGLTVYEEYRGFFENGEHFRSKPKEKELFVRDKIGGRTKRGIQVFVSATGLHVHHKLRDEELGEDRLINRNFGYAHQTNQHGVTFLALPLVEVRNARLHHPNHEGETGYGKKLCPLRTNRHLPLRSNQGRAHEQLGLVASAGFSLPPARVTRIEWSSVGFLPFSRNCPEAGREYLLPGIGNSGSASQPPRSRFFPPSRPHGFPIHAQWPDSF